MSEYKIIFPSNISYSCLCCGACCRKWQIPIGGDEAARFDETNWHDSLANAGLAEAGLARQSVYEPREEIKIELKKINYLNCKTSLKYNFKMRSDGCCIFLKKDNLCHMHTEKGIDYKAVTCKSFPVKLLYLPDNVVQVNYSFFCPGVYNEEKPSHDISEIEKLIACDNDKTIAEPLLEMAGGVEIEYRDMLQINHFVSDFLFDKNNASHLNDIDYIRDADLWNNYGSAMNFDKRMAVALYIVLFLSRLVKKLHEDDRENYREKFRSELANKPVMKKLIEKCSEIYDNSPSKNYGPLILMAFISLHQVGKKELNGMVKGFTVLFNMLKCSAKFGNFKLPDEGLNFGFKLHSLMKFDVDDSSLMAPVEKYLSHFIFRKRAFYADGILKQYQFLTLFYALIKWYAKAFAAQRKDIAANAGDVKKAVSLIEKGFANHSMLLNVLETNKNFDNIFNPLFENYSMIKTILS